MAEARPDKFSNEQLNYFRIYHVIVRVLPIGLCQVYKQEWNARYKTSHGEWNNSAKNGNAFYNMTTKRERKKKIKELSIIRNGNILDWDCTCLFYAILYSDCIGNKSLDPKVHRAVDNLRLFRNKFAHTIQDEVTDTDFQVLMQDVINAFNDLNLDTCVIQNLKSQASFNTDELQIIQEQLDKERRRNREPQTFCDLPPKPAHETIPRTSEVDLILKEMETLQTLHPNEVTHVYLSGNPGCGKSETARQIGKKFFADQNLSISCTKMCVITLDASNVDSLLNSYLECSRLLRIDEDDIQNIASSKSYSPKDKIRHFIGLVNLKLASFSSWLMIVDNVVKMDQFLNFFPSLGKEVPGKGQVLVTIQDSHSIPLASPFISHKSLSEGMVTDDAVNALLNISQQFEDKDVVIQIAKALDFQPLALACTAVYMKLVNQRGSSFTWANCLTKIQEEGKREQTEKPFLDATAHVYPHSMTSAVKLAVKRVVQDDNIMKFAFQFLSVLGRDAIPIKYVVQFVLLCMPDEDKMLTEDHIARSSLVLISDDDEDVRTHQIVHTVLQETVKHAVEGNCLSLANVIQSFSDLIVDDNEEPDYDFVTSTMSLISHFVTLEKSVSKNLPSSRNLSDDLLVSKCLSGCIGKICYINGQLEVAKMYLERSIEIKENTYNGKYLLAERNALGEILYEMRYFKEAKLCFEQALGSDQDSPHDINTKSGLYLRALTNLGMICSSMELGEIQKAEICLKEALPFVEKLIPHDPFAGRILNNIAVVYVSLKNVPEARTCMEKALTIDKETYGDNHPIISERYSDFATVLVLSGELKIAKEYLQKSISKEMDRHGENHSYLSTYYLNLGMVLKNLKEYEDAKKYMQRAVDIDERVYSDNNPALALALCGFGIMLTDLGEYETAKKYLQKAVDIDERIYGDNHPALAIHLNKLAVVLQKLGHNEDAKKYLQRAVDIGERVYDDNNPTLAIHLYEFGKVLKDLGQYEAAKKYMQRAVDIEERVYGDNNPDLAMHLSILAMLLQDLKQYEDAKRYLQRAVDIKKRHSDDNHSMLVMF